MQTTLHSKNVLNSDSELIRFVKARLICYNHAFSERHLQRLVARVGIVWMFVHWTAVRNTVTNSVPEIQPNLPQIFPRKWLQVAPHRFFCRKLDVLQIKVAHQYSCVHLFKLRTYTLFIKYKRASCVCCS